MSTKSRRIPRSRAVRPASALGVAAALWVSAACGDRAGGAAAGWDGTVDSLASGQVAGTRCSRTRVR